MRLTVKQLKRIIKEAVMNGRKGRKRVVREAAMKRMSEKRANEIFDAISDVHDLVEEEGTLVPWSDVVAHARSKGVKTTEDEIIDFIDTYSGDGPESRTLVGGYLDSWTYTNHIEDDGIRVYDPMAL